MSQFEFSGRVAWTGLGHSRRAGEESLPVISALVLLGAVGFTLVAAYQWAGRLGAFDVVRRELAVRIGKATFGKATSGTPYSPSSSGWFGFTARKHSCPEEVPEVRGVPCRSRKFDPQVRTHVSLGKDAPYYRS